MRKTLAALLLAVTLPSLTQAMPENAPPRGEHGPRFLKELDLSQEQRRAVGKLMGEQMRSRHEITQRYLDKLPAAERKALEDELKQAKEKNESAVRALLKPEQQKQFDELLKEHEAKRAERAEFEAWKAQRAQKTE